MEFSGEGVSVYAEAKGEYTRQLCQYLAPALHKYFLQLLETAKEREPDAKKHLVAFQNLLEAISEWNVDKVQRETQTIAMSSQCDYLEELLTAVFIAHTKVLSAIRLTNRHKKLQITIPKLEHFLHRTLTECARLLWMNTFLFSTTGTSLERQKNMRQIEALITEGVLQGVRTMLPVKSILREYLANEESGAEETDASESESEDESDAETEATEVTDATDATDVSDATAPQPQPTPGSVAAEAGPTGLPAAKPVEHVAAEPVEPTPAPTEPAALSTPETPVINLEEPPKVHFSEYDSLFAKESPAATTLQATAAELPGNEIIDLGDDIPIGLVEEEPAMEEGPAQPEEEETAEIEFEEL